MTSLVEARAVGAGYGARQVLFDIDLTFHAGERVVLLGPNGSGKSTLFRVLGKGIPCTAGTVRIQDRDVAAMSFADVARHVAVVPQEEPARFAFTVREVVTMGRLVRSSSLFDTDEDRHAADRAMAAADCVAYADRPFPDLSGGERQRVLIARALAQETPLILLDEPTSHLDPAHQVGVAQLVHSLADRGVTTVAAVHDLNLAASMASRAILLSGGRVRFDGPVEALLRDQRLDETYGVTFDRLEGPNGRLVLMPRLTSAY